MDAVLRVETKLCSSTVPRRNRPLSIPLGRLMDIDVLSAPGQHVSRTTLGQAPRKCLVCGGMAAACTRSRAHPVEQLIAAIDDLLEGWEENR